MLSDTSHILSCILTTHCHIWHYKFINPSSPRSSHHLKMAAGWEGSEVKGRALLLAVRCMHHPTGAESTLGRPPADQRRDWTGWCCGEGAVLPGRAPGIGQPTEDTPPKHTPKTRPKTYTPIAWSVWTPERKRESENF